MCDISKSLAEHGPVEKAAERLLAEKPGGPTELRSATMVAGAVKGSFYYLYRYTARGEGVRHQAEHAAGQAVPAHAEEGPDQRSGANCREKICLLSPHCPPPPGSPRHPSFAKVLRF